MSETGAADQGEQPIGHAPGPARHRSGRQELDEAPAEPTERLELAITVVVATPDLARRADLVAALEAAPGIQVVGEGGSDEEAINTVLALAPTVALIDVDPGPGFDGQAACLVLADKLATCAVVAVTGTEGEHLTAALRLGARSAHLLGVDDLAETVRGVARGEANLGPASATWVLAEIERLTGPEVLPAARPVALNDLERDVLERRGRGEAWTVIADTHHLTRRLVGSAAGTALAKVQTSMRLDRELRLIRPA